MSSDPSPIHATAVALHGPDGWRAVLLTGPSGAGKSDMALRLLAVGWRLVSDDYTWVWRSGEALYATAPLPIAGRIEVRGLGIQPTAPRLLARVGLIVACGRATVERMPEPDRVVIARVDLPRIALDTRPQSAVEGVAAALRRGVFQPAAVSSI